MRVQREPILDFHFAVIDLARLDARRYVQELNAAAMALSARMRVKATTTMSYAPTIRTAHANTRSASPTASP